MIRKRLITTAAAPLLALVFAVPASASAGSTRFASCATSDGGACAGYLALGGTQFRFRFVVGTAVLRDPSQYAAITNEISWQAGLKSTTAGNTWDVIAGVSNSTNPVGSVYSPAFDVYHNGALEPGAPDTNNAQWCPAGGTCQSASLGGGFPVGDTIAQSVFYNRAHGTVNVTESDAAGNAFRGFFTTGTGISFGQARIEAGYGTFSPPAANTKLIRVTSAKMTLYNGNGFSMGGWSDHVAEDGTSTGTGAGTLQAFPTALNSTGGTFSVSFEHAAMAHAG